MLDLAALRNFTIIARMSSISGASAVIGRTQSALSMQMQRLEGRIGHELLRRSGSGVQLTAAGERLLVHAGSLLALHDDILAEMGGHSLKGSLSLGCPEDYSAAFLPAMLEEFCILHPEVELRMICAPTTELRPLLRRRQIDLAIVSLADPLHPDALCAEPFVWMGNAPRPEVLDRPLLPLALSAPGTLDHQAALGAMEAAGRRFRVAFASNSLAGLVAITRSGQAISVLTRAAVPPDLYAIEEGLPVLPAIGIGVEFAEASPSAPARMLGAQIREALSRRDA